MSSLGLGINNSRKSIYSVGELAQNTVINDLKRRVEVLESINIGLNSQVIQSSVRIGQLENTVIMHDVKLRDLEGNMELVINYIRTLQSMP